MKRAFSTLLATVLASMAEQVVALRHIFRGRALATAPRQVRRILKRHTRHIFRGRALATAGAYGKFKGSRRARTNLNRVAMLLPSPFCRKKR